MPVCLPFLAPVTLLLLGSALAGPPFNTDDPVPVELHHWEIYLSSVFAHDASGSSGTAPHLDLNYGISPNVHVHLQTPMAFYAPAGEPRQYGYGDTEIGAKIRLAEESKGLPQVAIYPAIDFPTGSASRGLGSGNDALLSAGLAAKVVGAMDMLRRWRLLAQPWTGEPRLLVFRRRRTTPMHEATALGR